MGVVDAEEGEGNEGWKRRDGMLFEGDWGEVWLVE